MSDELDRDFIGPEEDKPSRYAPSPLGLRTILTRNPRDRPKELPARFLIDDVEVERKLPIKDHPYSLALQVWGEAGSSRFASIDAPFPEAYTQSLELHAAKLARNPRTDARSEAEHLGF